MNNGFIVKINRLKLSGVTVIVVIRDYSACHLRSLLVSFFKHNNYYPLEFIIVVRKLNNKSSEIIREFSCRAFFMTLEVEPNLKYIACANYAARRAVYPNLLFIDETVLYNEDVLPLAVKVLDDPFIGAVGVRLNRGCTEIATDSRMGDIIHSGVSFQWNEKNDVLQPYFISSDLLTDTEVIINGFYPALSGAFLLCRRTDFLTLGGFCDQYDKYYWDIDFCLRLAIDLGKKCFCINDISLKIPETQATLHRKEIHDKEELSLPVLDFDEQLFQERTANYKPLFVNMRQLSIDKRTSEDSPSLQLRVLFVAPSSLDSNNGYQIETLANGLVNLGAECTVAVPEQAYFKPEDTSKRYQINTYDTILKKEKPFVSGQHPNVIYAWTPRESIRLFVLELKKKFTCPVVLHLEDNEEYLTAATLGCELETLSTMSIEDLDKRLPKFRYHPFHGRRWLETVHGLTMVTETLQKYNYAGVEVLNLFPPPDESIYYPRPLNYNLRRQLSIPEDYTVFAYTGNAHDGNHEEVLTLYESVKLLNEMGCPAKLIRTGKNKRPLAADGSTWIDALEKPLGWVDRDIVPEVLAAADFLVQPGSPGVFNDYRIPCKVPEFFTIGRPVILPLTNIGLKVEHGKEAYVLEIADAVSIANAVTTIKKDRDLYETLSNGAVDFYLREISRPLFVQELYMFLYSIIKTSL